MRKTAKDLIGETFNHLTIIAADGTGRNKARCTCSCGNEIFMETSRLKSGNAKDCGCGVGQKLVRASRLVGKTYNDLTVIAADGKAPKTARCRCVCGAEIFVSPFDVASGHTKSCGCRNNRLQAEDRTGQVFGRLTILRRTAKRKTTEYVCRCECGNETVATWRNLRTENTRSCGCLKKEHAGTAHYRWLSLEAARAKLEKLTPQFTFPHLDVEWQGYDSVLTVVCEKHGVFKTIVSSSTFRGQLCWGCGIEARQESNGVGVSGPEIELREFLETLTPTTRGCLPGTSEWTFDIILPDLKIAVEFNGVYWHSYPRAKRGQHLYKRKFAEAAGYRMITVWEDQWYDERERVERYLTRVVKGAQRTVGARKCRVGSVPNAEALKFHDAWHLQGEHPTVATCHLGLYEGDSLIGLASFDRKGVLHRYTTGEAAVLGGLQKVLKASPFDEVTTYCDRDHFTGGVYAASGFTFTKYTLQLSYVENKRRVRRERYMKKNLPSIFGPDVDTSLTEHEICAQHGIYAAYNSGVDRWVWERKTHA